MKPGRERYLWNVKITWNEQQGSQESRAIKDIKVNLHFFSSHISVLVETRGHYTLASLCWQKNGLVVLSDAAKWQAASVAIKINILSNKPIRYLHPCKHLGKQCLGNHNNIHAISCSNEIEIIQQRFFEACSKEIIL